MTNKEAISIIESIRENYIPRKTVHDDALELAIKALEERPTGEWIDRNGNTTYPFWLRYECSICHGHSGMGDYCYHCGAKMKGEEA